ncbi:hypothetical protein [Paraburkholderia phenazinium]|uniref:Uncharacterized protein n=1 Tax=Paraburkholderia phenazinium TaxID=60549 RepID=A0A1N6EQ07_9BURK|nr:hypothetical protein [Paraburkholderia phenazinium]SIN85084.1 hypothetical protein SAMN05444168_0866 [Paraburkholderia phenazinium]
MMNPELAAELADEAQLKAAIRELRKLRKESEPLKRAWSDTRVARQRYEREYAFAVKQLREREDRIMDELAPYLDKIEALEKQVRKRTARYGKRSPAKVICGCAKAALQILPKSLTLRLILLGADDDSAQLSRARRGGLARFESVSNGPRSGRDC